MGSLNYERPDGGYIHVPVSKRFLFFDDGIPKSWGDTIPQPAPSDQHKTLINYDDHGGGVYRYVRLDRWVGYAAVQLEHLSDQKLELILSDFQLITDQVTRDHWQPMINCLVDEMRDRAAGDPAQEPDEIDLTNPRVPEGWEDFSPEFDIDQYDPQDHELGNDAGGPAPVLDFRDNIIATTAPGAWTTTTTATTGGHMFNGTYTTGTLQGRPA